LSRGSAPDWEAALISARSTSLQVRASELDSSCGGSQLLSGVVQAVSGALGSSEAPRKLQRTFGYVGGFEKPAPFARFDVRDDICKKVGGFTHGQVVKEKDGEGNAYIVIGVKPSADSAKSDSRALRLWFKPKALERPAGCCFNGLSAAALSSLFIPTGQEVLTELKPGDCDVIEDSDGELVTLCHDCLLPLGSCRYTSLDGEGLIHGECMARCLLDAAKAAEARRKSEEERKKARDREEYSIGWKHERMIPRSEDILRERKVSQPVGATKESLYCLSLQAGGASEPMRLAIRPTTDPECSVNLAYLMCALQVRIKAGMAPYFSLDTPNANENWQQKTFGPPWLRGTCVGEVLFQADYHLKELSMGESIYDQPVGGMMNVFDFMVKEEGWRGREWFVVKHAAVQVSANNILVPYVEMGVEAREQVANDARQLVDAPVTSKSHPLVKYADLFTHFFNLIAERKSVVYQLREVSKAAIIAKFLVDNKVALEDFWLKAEEGRPCALDLPFNRTERHVYEILVCDGVVKEQYGGTCSNWVGLFGGVDLNIDAFDLSMPAQLARQVKAPDYAAIYSQVGQLGTEEELGRLSVRELRRLVDKAGGNLPAGPMEKSDLIAELLLLRKGEVGGDGGQDDVQPDEDGGEGLSYAAELREDLLKLNMSEDLVKSVVSIVRARHSGAAPSGKVVAAPGSFWERWKEDTEESRLMRNIFDSHLGDRRSERSRFVPPVATEAYTKKLQTLVMEEREVPMKRKAHFSSAAFSLWSPGPLFPSSWRPNFLIHFGKGSSVSHSDSTRPARMEVAEIDATAILREVKPSFERSTEDRVQYRIYNQGPYEVRTIQEKPEEQEVVVATFRLTPSEPPLGTYPVVKVTEFVRSTAQATVKQAPAEETKPGDDATPAPVATTSLHCYWVAYETDLGDVLITELTDSSSILWEENPLDMETRLWHSRIVRVADCGSAGVTVADLRLMHEKASEAPSSLSSRRFAAEAFTRVKGKCRAVQVLAPPGT